MIPCHTPESNVTGPGYVQRRVFRDRGVTGQNISFSSTSRLLPDPHGHAPENNLIMMYAFRAGQARLVARHANTLGQGMERIRMEPQEFMDKWRIDKPGLAELLDLSKPQVDRWFFAADSKSYMSPKQSHKDRLAEIDLILTMRSTMQMVSNSDALQRLNNIIPKSK